MPAKEKPVQNKIMLAVSGGIDSAVAIHLLQERGFTVFGVHFNFWHWETDRGKSEMDVLNSLEEIFGIDILTVNYETEFKNIIVDQLISDQKQGFTPNPCVRCNPFVKFRLLMDLADKEKIKNIATGHYARVYYDSQSDRFLLKTAADKNKDQSYVLCYLTQEILSRSIFPLGDYTKQQIYKIGINLGLPITEESESQDLCFVKPENYTKFLEENISSNISGNICGLDGKVLGKHNGLHHYTIGQRKGIRIPAVEPYYVLRKIVATNTLIVGSKDDLDKIIFEVDNVNWIINKPSGTIAADVKIRYRSNRFPAQIIAMDKGRYRIITEDPVRAITPGQYAVFYKDDIVIGGGRIL